MIDEKRLVRLLADKYNRYWNNAQCFQDIETDMALRVMLEVHSIIDLIREPDVPEMNVGKWIPCSERLPEESLRSVIGWDAYRDRCVFVQRYGGRWVLGDNEAVKVIAWMPLPEPYREDGGNDETD